MPAYFGPMLAPFTKHEVASLADFSARRPAQGTPQDAPPQQCFDKVTTSPACASHATLVSSQQHLTSASCHFHRGACENFMKGIVAVSSNCYV
jgi:hypothetical protein